jgi:hypothetical protein
VRLVDEFLAKSNLQSCVNFRETAQVIAKVGFKMFLGIAADGQNRTHPRDRLHRGLPPESCSVGNN